MAAGLAAPAQAGPVAASRGRVATSSPRLAGSAPAARLFEPGSAPLEDAILSAWRAITDRGGAGCPVCGSRMAADGGCSGCGSQLS